MAKWTKAQHEKYAATLKRKSGQPLSVNNTLEQQPAVDVHNLAQYNYRRGLLAALNCILRELQ